MKMLSEISRQIKHRSLVRSLHLRLTSTSHPRAVTRTRTIYILTFTVLQTIFILKLDRGSAMSSQDYFFGLTVRVVIWDIRAGLNQFSITLIISHNPFTGSLHPDRQTKEHVVGKRLKTEVEVGWWNEWIVYWGFSTIRMTWHKKALQTEKMRV